MKILHVISGLQYGGAENLLFQLLQMPEFSTFDHQVISLTGLGPIGESMQELGLDVIALNFSSHKLNIKPLIAFLDALRNYQPDILQTWLFHADLAGAVAHLVEYKTPLVWSVHHATAHMNFFKRSTKIVIQINRILSRWIPERIVCCSPSVYDAHQRMGYPADRMVIIRNGVNCSRFQRNDKQYSALREELGFSPTALLVGYSGRWIPSKGYRILIQAASTLTSQHPDLHFLLWGQGIDSQNEELTTMLKDFSVLGHFSLLGATASAEKFLQGLDIYTSPSLDEALPMSVAEAMACQVPCVVTDVGDQGKLVGQTGVVIQPDDVQEIVKGIKNIIDLDEPSQRQKGYNARERILNHYSLDTTAEQYSQMYQQLGNATGK
jgi:glycosyltransferase involved in cell wall biosynthesis